MAYIFTLSASTFRKCKKRDRLLIEHNLKQRNTKKLKVQTVQRAFDLVKSLGGHMRVYFRCFGAAVSEQALEIAQVGALLQQVCGEGMAQS